MKTVKLPKGKTFEFKQRGTVSKYPWDAMFTGDLVQITKAEDYPELDTDDMPPKIKTAARRRYKVCAISKVDHEGTNLVDSLILQARDMTPEERAIEDAKRAEEKIKNATRRAEEKAAGTEDEGTAEQNEAA